MNEQNGEIITRHFYVIDNEIFEILKKYLPHSIKQIERTKLPFTLKALLHLHTVSNFIKNGIPDLVNSDNLYGSKILYRLLIEHYLKSEYLFIKAAKDGNDAAGHDYFTIYDFDENRKYANSCKYSASLYGIDINESLNFETLRKALPKTKDLSNNEIRDKISQFNYRKIISFIIKTLDANEFKGNTFFMSLIPIFSQLSSFVYAGPFANKEMLKNKNPNERKEVYTNKLEITLLISANIILRYFTVLSLFHEDHQKAIEEIDNITQKIKP